MHNEKEGVVVCTYMRARVCVYVCMCVRVPDRIASQGYMVAR